MVFCKNREQDVVQKGIDILLQQLAIRHYHVAVGLSHRTQNIDVNEMVHEAEKKMYEAKAQYYHNKESVPVADNEDQAYIQLKTGIPEIDTILSVLKEKYNGIYRVSLSEDMAKRILMPAYLQYNENEDRFQDLIAKYVAEAVEPDYHRAMTTFLNYDALKKQLSEGAIPRITYKKLDGESVALSVYKLSASDEEVEDSLWFFAKA